MQTSIATIQRALDLGITLLDTAAMYGVDRNEELVGCAIRWRRDEVVLVARFGNVRAADGSYQGIEGRPECLVQACEARLRWLGVETIDLYYLHHVDPNTPIEVTVGAIGWQRDGRRRRTPAENGWLLLLGARHAQQMHGSVDAARAARGEVKGMDPQGSAAEPV